MRSQTGKTFEMRAMGCLTRDVERQIVENEELLRKATRDAVVAKGGSGIIDILSDQVDDTDNIIHVDVTPLAQTCQLMELTHCLTEYNLQQMSDTLPETQDWYYDEQGARVDADDIEVVELDYNSDASEVREGTQRKKEYESQSSLEIDEEDELLLLVLEEQMRKGEEDVVEVEVEVEIGKPITLLQKTTAPMFDSVMPQSIARHVPAPIVHDAQIVPTYFPQKSDPFFQSELQSMGSTESEEDDILGEMDGKPKARKPYTRKTSQRIVTTNEMNNTMSPLTATTGTGTMVPSEHTRKCNKKRQGQGEEESYDLGDKQSSSGNRKRKAKTPQKKNK
jgi:hypothetical protein